MVVSLATTALAVVGSLAAAVLVWFAITSIREREQRAVRILSTGAVVVAVSTVGATLLPPLGRVLAASLSMASVVASATALAVPIGRVLPGGRTTRRVDEREIMFARARLSPGSPEFDAYYAMRPEHRAGDDRTRALPGLLSLDARKADPAWFASAEASFRQTEAMAAEVDGPIAGQRREMAPDEASGLVKDRAVALGAVDAGVAEVAPAHVYTHVGRGAGTYGDPVILDHGWAVAFTVEMDHAVMRTAPEAPVVAESARRYVEAAVIAVRLAAEIRAMGHAARAHIDGNYRVIAPLVARDAGLGEIGRMGILMTRRLGPRVRIGVVTTSLPLQPDPPGDDLSVLDFCTICRKCADNCPSQSISFGGRESVDGGLRWALDADSCFRYWNLIGTDCGRCMTVCPYAHPHNAAHGLVRWMLQRSGAARRAGRRLDDAVYGRRPTALDPADLR